MTAPSRLYRSFPGLPRPLFTVSAGGQVWDDTAIRSIVIRHGKESAAGGVHPSTCEIHLAQDVPLLNDSDVSVLLSSAAALSLADSYDARHRFHGRVGAQETTEHADVRAGYTRAPRRDSVLMCSSWSSVPLSSTRPVSAPNLASLYSVLEELWAQGSPPGVTFTRHYTGDFENDNINQDHEGTFTELLEKFTADIGILVRHRRDGSLEAMTNQARTTAAENAAANRLPLTRSQVTAGVVHRQKVDQPNLGVRLTWTDATAGTRTRVWAYGTDDVSQVVAWEEVDWTHIAWTTEQYRWAVNALAHQLFRVAYTTPAVTVDLLHLARSPLEYHRIQLRQLLLLQPGDPIVLGSDWDPKWSGIHFAEQITETITADTWTLELSLYSGQEVTGRWGVPSDPPPTIAIRTWDQARRPWTAVSGPWDAPSI